ncbi:hypothetical protein [Chryseobacterium sp.]|uniref:hypothetical protein n=1 Tax=Chryseobacterium sp. TaxID=1871047 RepID=UPI0025BCD54C|nr:hypothetical protein [Chryseobacterium sp.]
MINRLLLLSIILFGLNSNAQVGIQTANPGSTLDVRGSFATPYKNVTATTYDLVATDQYLDFRGTAAGTWTLPAAQPAPTNFAGRIYEIRNGGAFDLTVLPNGTETIDVSNVSNGQNRLTIPAGYYATIKNTGNTTGTTWVVTLLTAGNTTSQGSSGFSTSILGYTPKKASQRTVPATFYGTSVAERGCKKWAGNGHTYCAYQFGNAKNFYDTFDFARTVGGYIVTMTSNNERAWVNSNILAASPSGYSFDHSIWIGYNKVAYPGNPVQFTWITGEDWVIDWNTSPNSTPQNWFNSGEPNNAGGSEGSCHILATNRNTARRWNDLNGTSTNDSGNAGTDFDQVILEFNED